jgi:hypothetical protein
LSAGLADLSLRLPLALSLRAPFTLAAQRSLRVVDAVSQAEALDVGDGAIPDQLDACLGRPASQ